MKTSINTFETTLYLPCNSFFGNFFFYLRGAWQGRAIRLLTSNSMCLSLCQTSNPLSSLQRTEPNLRNGICALAPETLCN